MGDTKYCLCCGEEVPYYIVERDQKKEYVCSFCGFTLEVEKLWESHKTPVTPQEDDNISGVPIAVDSTPENPRYSGGSPLVADSGAPTANNIIPKNQGFFRNSQLKENIEKKEPEQKDQGSTEGQETLLGNSTDTQQKSEIEKQRFEVINQRSEPPGQSRIQKDQIERPYALVAEDSEFLRILLKKLILKKSLAEKVIDVSNGLELVTEYTRLINEKAKINFAIVDLHMPEMDGLTATRIIRALEDKNSISRTPIVFFSAIRADENLKSQMKLLEPAHYINKGIASSPQSLSERVEVLLHFLTYRYKQFRSA